MRAALKELTQVSECSIPEEVLSTPLPAHVAIIMDGNGRWATERRLPRTAGHLRGIRSLRRAVMFARKEGIQHLTVFAFSTENWKRSAGEVSFIMRLLERYLIKESARLTKNGIRLKVIGERETLPQALQIAIRFAENAIVKEPRMILTLAVSYGGQDEIVAATRSILKAYADHDLDPSALDRDVFARHLLAPELPPVDLLIRTGGEQRISNFLLWQLAYAELCFLPIFWPDFRDDHFLDCLRSFQGRHRRYGREL